MTSLWIQTQIDSISNEFWYIDYLEKKVIKSDKRPKYQSVRKWKGTIEDYLDSRDFNYIREDKHVIKIEEKES